MRREQLIAQLSQEGKKPLLLIVDDQPVNILALNTLFETDFDVLMATDGETAVRIAQERTPDTILLDINMPGVSGYEVCERLAKDESTKDIPIIFVTGETEEHVEEHVFDIGGVDFITKPINPAIVRARVLTHVLLKLQMDKIKDIAHIDGLTGLYNRRRFDEALNFYWRLSIREDRPLSLLMIDVDYFKNYNDHYGHVAGDEALKMVAEVLRSSLRRTSDMCCRYGGEEFACLLPFTDAKGALDRAKLILKDIAEKGLVHEFSATAEYLTVSIGVSSLNDDTQSEMILLNQSDEALYMSKHSGRNRASLYEAALEK